MLQIENIFDLIYEMKIVINYDFIINGEIIIDLIIFHEYNQAN
jgi:hypothetical protein